MGSAQAAQPRSAGTKSQSVADAASRWQSQLEQESEKDLRRATIRRALEEEDAPTLMRLIVEAEQQGIDDSEACKAFRELCGRYGSGEKGRGSLGSQDRRNTWPVKGSSDACPGEEKPSRASSQAAAPAGNAKASQRAEAMWSAWTEIYGTGEARFASRDSYKDKEACICGAKYRLRAKFCDQCGRPRAIKKDANVKDANVKDANVSFSESEQAKRARNARIHAEWVKNCQKDSQLTQWEALQMLGFPSIASSVPQTADLKAAYHVAAKKFHPDRPQNKARQKEATEEFQRLQIALNMLLPVAGTSRAPANQAKKNAQDDVYQEVPSETYNETARKPHPSRGGGRRVTVM